MVVMFMAESEQMDSLAACLYSYYRILRMGHYRMLIPLTSFPVVAYPGILFVGGFNKFSLGQRTERMGIWGTVAP